MRAIGVTHLDGIGNAGVHSGGDLTHGVQMIYEFTGVG